MSLSIWGGKEFDSLICFISKMRDDIDVFCFQEMVFGHSPVFSRKLKIRENIFSELTSILFDFDSFEYRAAKGSFIGGEKLNSMTDVGQAIFVRKSIIVKKSGGFRTYDLNGSIAKDVGQTITGNFQFVILDINGKEVSIGNLHGLWQGGTEKKDTPERIYQSEKMMEFINSRNGYKILLGDFNVRPDTECIKILDRRLKNLIVENKIDSTRSRLYTKPIKFSDYVFISPDLPVNDFTVLEDVVSDHLPLLLDVSI